MRIGDSTIGIRVRKSSASSPRIEKYDIDSSVVSYLIYLDSLYQCGI